MHLDSTNTSFVKSSSAKIIPIDRESRLPAEKAEYMAAIQLWCRTRDAADSLSRAEIGELKALSRIDAQRKAIVIHLAHYYRKHTRVDPAPAIAVITALMTDNDKGVCSISQETFGRLLGRSTTSIREAQKRLKEDGIIVMGRGRYAGSYPVVPRAVTVGYNHMTWLIGALCDEEKPLNVPGSLADCQSAGGPCGLTQSEREPCGLDDVNPQDNGFQSAGGPCAYFTTTSTTTNTSARDNGCSTRKIAATVVSVIGAATASLPVAASPIAPPAIIEAAPSKISYDDLMRSLLDAGGLPIADPAKCAALLLLQEPYRWLENGCDLSMDIIPTIRARTAKMKPDSVRSWVYFTDAIIEARDKRLKPIQNTKREDVSKSASLNGFVPPEWEKDLQW